MAKDRLRKVLEKYEAVIGLEIHTEITAVNSKMFCSCPVEFGGEVNSRVCPVCIGLPGALPVPNEKAIEWTVLCGLATGCDINLETRFDRKNYFYPDMPANYQITQADSPFCVNGGFSIEIDEEGVEQRLDLENNPALTITERGYETRIGITRMHLEEDTGKMIHIGGSDGRISGATHSLADFNRAGTPLMELVTEPDIRTPEEARRFAQKLRSIWITLGASDCNMEEGSMRCDANISLRLRGTEKFGTKAELKNMNSFKAIHDGLVAEILRQAEMLDAGERIIQETRHYDAITRRTHALRSKETADDYRYFPEPDLPPVVLTAEYVENLRAQLPELPEARRDRYIADFELPFSDASLIAADLPTAHYFEKTVAAGEGLAPKALANYILNELGALLNTQGIDITQTSVSPAHIVELARAVADDIISSKQAKEVFAEMGISAKMPSLIIEEKGMKQVSDSSAIEAVIDEIMAAHADKVADYRGGKTGLIGFFVGQVMRNMGGQANPKVVNDILTQKLEA